MQPITCFGAFVDRFLDPPVGFGPLLLRAGGGQWSRSFGSVLGLPGTVSDHCSLVLFYVSQFSSHSGLLLSSPLAYFRNTVGWVWVTRAGGEPTHPVLAPLVSILRIFWRVVLCHQKGYDELIGFGSIYMARDP